MFPGISFVVPSFARVIDRILDNCVGGVHPCLVVAFALSMASFRSWSTSLVRSHATVTIFPYLLSVLTNL